MTGQLRCWPVVRFHNDEPFDATAIKYPSIGSAIPVTAL
jgi:hypothetical protein